MGELPNNAHKCFVVLTALGSGGGEEVNVMYTVGVTCMVDMRRHDNKEYLDRVEFGPRDLPVQDFVLLSCIVRRAATFSDKDDGAK